MGVERKPFQGVYNILRFNWHFYVIASVILVALVMLRNLFPPFMESAIVVAVIVVSVTVFISLGVSFYVYDVSNLYELKWLGDIDNQKILNINAGFDETSKIIRKKSTSSEVIICDFYDPEKHTEVSIKRARRAYPPIPGTIAVVTHQLPFAEGIFDKTIAILSAHEIRNEAERIQFFKELNRITKTSGQLLITEHLRDGNNFLAYTVGFLHFHSKASWLRTFKGANLRLKQSVKTTPFITTFILEKHGDTL